MVNDIDSAADGRPVENSYRVGDVPLFAGEYPFAPHPAKGRALLERFLDVGITTFVDLTTHADPLAPYEATLMDVAAERGVGAEYHRVAIDDLGVPASPDVMQRALDIIDAALAENRSVYVHCWGGVGRTGTVIGCYLVRRGANGTDALTRVGELFATMSAVKRANHPQGSPQTREQRRYVLKWRDAATDEPPA